jgi:hypothetical protein
MFYISQLTSMLKLLPLIVEGDLIKRRYKKFMMIHYLDFQIIVLLKLNMNSNFWEGVGILSRHTISKVGHLIPKQIAIID